MSRTRTFFERYLFKTESSRLVSSDIESDDDSIESMPTSLPSKRLKYLGEINYIPQFISESSDYLKNRTIHPYSNVSVKEAVPIVQLFFNTSNICKEHKKTLLEVISYLLPSDSNFPSTYTEYSKYLYDIVSQTKFVRTVF